MHVEVVGSLICLDHMSVTDLHDDLIRRLGLGTENVLEQHPVRFDAKEFLAQHDEAREMCDTVRCEVR